MATPRSPGYPDLSRLMLKKVLDGRLAEVSATYRYAAGIVLALLSVLLRLALNPLFGSGFAYFSLFPAVLFTAMALGQGPGIAASAVGAVATELVLVPHTGGPIVTSDDWFRIAVVVCSAVMIGEMGRRMRESRAALGDMNTRKNEFLAVLSHELRNPLGTIRGALSVLDRSMVPAFEQTPDAQRARTIIDRQVAQLSRLVDDLLDVSRLKTGKIRIDKRIIDLKDLSKKAIEDNLPVLAAGDLALDVRLPDKPVWTNGDPGRFMQIVGNLLLNAAKFTPPGGRVLVSLTSDPHVARLRVRDNGLGLDARAQATLFEPFAHSDASAHPSRGGLGIGLALVKALVELHHGQVHATSDGPGTGAEFEVVLPLASEHGAAALDVENAAASDAVKKRVLIIEDSRDFAAMLQVLFQVMGGHEVHLADSGPKGIEIARRIYPDVVVCDIGLPVMDGYEVARALRAQPAARNALLIALTGYASVDDAKRAVEAGFNYHVPKGGDPEAVMRLLGSLPQPDSES